MKNQATKNGSLESRLAARKGPLAVSCPSERASLSKKLAAAVTATHKRETLQYP